MVQKNGARQHLCWGFLKNDKIISKGDQKLSRAKRLWLMKNFKNRLRQGLLLASLLVMLISCQTMDTDVTEADDWHCFAYLPIAWSKKDTLETIDQIKQHNAVWAALCENNSLKFK